MFKICRHLVYDNFLLNILIQHLYSNVYINTENNNKSFITIKCISLSLLSQKSVIQ